MSDAGDPQHGDEGQEDERMEEYVPFINFPQLSEADIKKELLLDLCLSKQELLSMHTFQIRDCIMDKVQKMSFRLSLLRWRDTRSAFFSVDPKHPFLSKNASSLFAPSFFATAKAKFDEALHIFNAENISYASEATSKHVGIIENLLNPRQLGEDLLDGFVTILNGCSEDEIREIKNKGWETLLPVTNSPCAASFFFSNLAIEATQRAKIHVVNQEDVTGATTLEGLQQQAKMMAAAVPTDEELDSRKRQRQHPPENETGRAAQRGRGNYHNSRYFKQKRN